MCCSNWTLYFPLIKAWMKWNPWGACVKHLLWCGWRWRDSVTIGGRRRAREKGNLGAWLHKKATRSREIPKCNTNVDLRFQASHAQRYADSRVLHFEYFLLFFLSHPLTPPFPPPAVQGCFRYGHFDTNRYWQIRVWNELITRRLDTRSCPLPNYKRSCMFTEPWIPIHSLLFLASRLCDDGQAALRLTYDEFHKLINCFVGYVKTCSTNQFMVANVGTGIKCLVAFVGSDSFAKLAKLITSYSLLMTALAV